MNRRELIQGGATLFASTALAKATYATVGIPIPKKIDDAFEFLKLGEIAPSGWLKQQLLVQAKGMSGHLDEFWDDVGSNSGWLGGSGESWERGPYFIDGLYPLSVLLDDTRLRAKAMRFIEWTLTHQQPNGMIGPISNDDWWPRMVMLKALAQHHDATNDERVLNVLTRYFHHQLSALPNRPLKDWGRYRWQDEALVVIWLHRKTSDPQLVELYELLKKQGFDWPSEFRSFPFKTPQTRAVLKMRAGAETALSGMETHGVNNGQALKTAAVRYMTSSDKGERANFVQQLEELYRYHGQPNGMFSCDEHLAGLDPSQDTELCTVVETMYSLEIALAVFGDAFLGDRIERIAYNALPGTFTDDMWAHQYDQQANQVRVSRNSAPWTTNGPESNLYGLEPNFGCCTANFHQGWPKFAASLWMRSQDDGVAAVLWAPCSITTKIRETNTAIRVETEYPFRGRIKVNIDPDRPVDAPLHFRIPDWSAETTIAVNGEPVREHISQGTFFRIQRIWRKGDSVDINFRMRPEIDRGFRDSASVRRGPIVFSHSPGEMWSMLRRQGSTADWQVFGRESWNFALAVDEKNAASLPVLETPVGSTPFSKEGCGVKVKASGRRLTKWLDTDGVADSVPQSPVSSSEPLQELTLIPYAAAKLRITAFPVLSSS